MDRIPARSIFFLFFKNDEEDSSEESQDSIQPQTTINVTLNRIVYPINVRLKFLKKN